MNFIEKQTELGRSLFQINTNSLREYAEIQRETIGKYVELNTNYGKQLPAVKNISDFVSLQREYNQSVWSGVRSTVKSQTNLVKGAFEEAGVALKNAYTQTATEAPVEEKATAKKAKAA